MDTSVGMYRMEPEQITFRCRNKTNWFRIFVLTIISALITWLAYGAAYTCIGPGCTFWQALVTPVTLVFTVLHTVALFCYNLKNNTDR